jgi:hypothetical protein
MAVSFSPSRSQPAPAVTLPAYSRSFSVATMASLRALSDAPGPAPPDAPPVRTSRPVAGSCANEPRALAPPSPSSSEYM